MTHQPFTKAVLLVMMASLAISFTACQGSGSSSGNGEEHHQHEDEHGHEDGHGDHHGEGHQDDEHAVTVSAEQLASMNLTTGPLKKMELKGEVEVTGELSLFPQDRARMSPYFGGNITQINVIEGDQVNKGEVLAWLRHPDYIQMQQDLQQAASELEYLKAEYERKKRLHEKDVTSGQKFQRAKADYFSTRSSVNSLKEKLNLLGIDVQKVLEGEIVSRVPVRAPISGFVHHIHVSISDYAAPEEPMFEITENSRIHVDLRVFEKDVHKVEKGQKVVFTVANKPGELLTARIHSIGRAFEGESKSIHLHAHLDNKSRDLLPGMYVEGRVLTGAADSSTVVPEEAVVTEENKRYIFVKEAHEDDDHHRFVMKQVRTGSSFGGYTEVRPVASLPPGQQVVQKGAYYLVSEMKKGEGGHSH